MEPSMKHSLMAISFILMVAVPITILQNEVNRHTIYWVERVYHLTELEMVANELDIQKEVTIESPSLIFSIKSLEDFMDKAKELNTSVVYSDMLPGRVPPFGRPKEHSFKLLKPYVCLYSYYIFNEEMTVAYRYTLKIERVESKWFSEFRRVN